MDPKLRSAYRAQKSGARRRGIAWEFDLDSWHLVWSASGFLEQRGMGKGRYVMARRGDVGPYSPSNVEIILCEVNARDSRLNHPGSQRASAIGNTGRGRGWTFVKGGYQVYVSKRYIGRFGTPDLAEAAYAAACAEHRSSFVVVGV